LKLVIAFGVCAAVCDGAWAASAGGWVKGSVLTDGGSVYERPDFDSPVLDYLAFKTPVSMSRAPSPGEGGLGLFYRVHYQNKTGYMADTDVKSSGEAVAAVGGKPRKKKDRRQLTEEEKEREKRPFVLRRYVGGAFAVVNYKEKFSGNTGSTHLSMFGVRATGPRILFDGISVDLNLWFTLQKPGYFGDFGGSVRSGYLLFGDMDLLMPVAQAPNWMVNFAVGPMWAYESYQVQVKHSYFDSQEFRLGLDLGLGGGYRVQNWAFRLDAKYYIEKTQYLGWIVSAQMEF
jgi:hypothetical protein